jgi:hypothetical protein
MKKSKTLIIESVIEKPVLVEAETLPSGVLCRVEYPICNIGQLNANHRRYGKNVWECVLAKPDIKEKLEKRSLFGQGEHPAGTQSDLQLTSHVVTEFRIDEKEGKVYQKFDVLNTPAGRIINELLRAGCGVGVSTRAEGELKEAEENGQKIYDVIAESYDYITTDFTSNPSTANMAAKSIEMLRGKIQSEVKDESLSDGERKFATAILESITTNIETDDASISVTDDGSVSVTKKAGVSALPTPPPVTEEPLPTEEIQPEGGELEELEDETEEELEEAKVKEAKLSVEEIKKLFKSIDAGYAKMLSGVVTSKKQAVEKGKSKGLELSDEGKKELGESKSISNLYKEIVELKVKEASVRAERDVALEESKQVVASNRALKVEVNTYRKLVGNGKNIVEGFNAKIKVLGDMLKGEVSKYKKLLEAKEKNITEINESKSTEIEKASKLAYCKLLKEYVEKKISDSGLKLNNSSLALLEECDSIAEVDESFNGIVDAMRVSALHGVGAKTIEVVSERKPISEDERRDNKRKVFIKESVKSVLKGL